MDEADILAGNVLIFIIDNGQGFLVFFVLMSYQHYWGPNSIDLSNFKFENQVKEFHFFSEAFGDNCI